MRRRYAYLSSDIFVICARVRARASCVRGAGGGEIDGITVLPGIIILLKHT